MSIDLRLVVEPEAVARRSSSWLGIRSPRARAGGSVSSESASLVEEGLRRAWSVALRRADEQEHGIRSEVIVAALLATAYLIYGHIGLDFLPHMDEASIILDCYTRPGTSRAATDAMLQYAEEVSVSIPDISSYSRRTGAQLECFITQLNSGDYVIKPKVATAGGAERHRSSRDSWADAMAQQTRAE